MKDSKEYLKNSKMYQIYELRDELKKRKAAIEVKDESQKRLMAIIIGAKADGEFRDLIKGFNDELKQDESEIANINTKVQALNRIIALHEAQDQDTLLVNNVVTDLLTGLGLVYKKKEKGE